MTSALVGFTGFVGQNLRDQRSFTHLFNSKNIKDIHGQSFDVLYVAACPAEKWRANKDPETDKARILALQDDLVKAKAKVVVLISTIDVYVTSREEKQDEDTPCKDFVANHHAYGKHRFEFEDFIRSSGSFEKVIVVRLPALYGPYLKKNYIYDLLNDNGPEKINRNTCFQWYDMSNLENDIQATIKAGLTLANLFPEPIWTEDLLRVAKETGAVKQCVLDKVPSADPSARGVVYKIYTKYGEQLGQSSPDSPGFLYSGSHALKRLADYFRTYLQERKLVLSNIAWDWCEEKEHSGVMDLIKGIRLKKIEFAPTKLWGSWDKVKEAFASGEVKKAGEELRKKGITVPSYQAVLFNCPECQLLKDDESKAKLLEHMKFIVDFCAVFSGSLDDQSVRPPAIVYGAPRNRLLFDRTVEDAKSIAQGFFKELGEYAISKRVVVCLEANPQDYKCEFLYNAVQAAEMVRMVKSDGFKLHIDLACMTLGKDDVEAIVKENKDIVYHVHISEPFLADFAEPKCDHAAFAKSLRDHGLFHNDVHLSIEMRNGDDNVSRVKTAVSYVRKTYFGFDE